MLSWSDAGNEFHAVDLPPCHGKTARTVMGCSCRWDNKVTTCNRTEVATSRTGRDWLAVITEVGLLWRQVVRTLEHNQTQYKLDTLVDWQPVKEITHRKGNAVVFAPAEYQSSCGVKDSLQLPHRSMYAGRRTLSSVTLFCIVRSATCRAF